MTAFYSILGKQLFTAKLATEAVLKDAKEIRLGTGPYVNYVDDAEGSFKKYEKSGGYKQAYKDFKRFPADERQNFLMPYGVCIYDQTHFYVFIGVNTIGPKIDDTPFFSSKAAYSLN